jgi:hypothetical protein
LIRKLIVAMVAAAMLVAMAVPAFAQSPFDLALQLQNCEQVNANVNIADQDNTANNTQNPSGFFGLINVNQGSGDQTFEQNPTSVQAQSNQANPNQTNERNVQVCAALQWANDGFGEPKRDGVPAPAGLPGL